jgi:hypothetical protein
VCCVGHLRTHCVSYHHARPFVFKRNPRLKPRTLLARAAFQMLVQKRKRDARENVIRGYHEPLRRHAFLRVHPCAPSLI